jgi:hypothetical protein
LWCEVTHVFSARRWIKPHILSCCFETKHLPGQGDRHYYMININAVFDLLLEDEQILVSVALPPFLLTVSEEHLYGRILLNISLPALLNVF